MKTLKIVILLIIIQVTLNAQVKRVAILDFENNSGNTSYDYLGKALSNMLITDLSNNIHPKNAIFIERNQLNNDIIIAKKIYSDLINDNVDENYEKWSMTFDNFQYILGSFNNRDKNILLTKTQMKNFIDDRIKKELATYKFNKDLIVKIQ